MDEQTFQTRAGIYVFCMDHHEGQWSRLYRLMCRIRFSAPDRVFDAIHYGKHDPHGEWEHARRTYRKLKRKYGK